MKSLSDISANGFASGVSAFYVGGGGLTSVDVTVDFGSTPVYSKDFSITDAAATTSSIVWVTTSGKSPAGGYADELEMDPIIVNGRVEVNGTVIIKVISTRGRLRGKRRLQYFLT